MYTRFDTLKLNIGDVTIGGGSPVAVQSMANTDTADAKATSEQILRLEALGCEIARVAVPDMEAAEALPSIISRIHIPLVADIHFDYRLALAAVRGGVQKVRINPGDIGSVERVRAVVDACKERNVPIRIGVNGGSLEKPILEKYGRPTAAALVESALGHIKILEDLDFDRICVSLKCSDAAETVRAYRLLAEKVRYPLHIGLTEAGTVYGGTIKSCAALGALLMEDIGDTLRVSLTGEPEEEVRVGTELLAALGLSDRRKLEFVSCPTCGRTKIDLIPLAGKIERRLRKLEAGGAFKRRIKVAVMGCAVNGPGEASDADIGLAGGVGRVMVFEKGVKTGVLSGSVDEIAAKFIEKVLELAKND